MFVVVSFSVLFLFELVVSSLSETSFSELRVVLFSFLVGVSLGLAFATRARNLSIALISIVRDFSTSEKFTVFLYGVSMIFNESGESLKIPASKLTLAVSSGVSSTFLLSVVLFSYFGVLTSLLDWLSVLLSFSSTLGVVFSVDSVVLCAYFSKSALLYLALENSIGNVGTFASLANWLAEERSVEPSLSVSLSLLYFSPNSTFELLLCSSA